MAELTVDQIKKRDYSRIVFADTPAEFAAGRVYCAFLKTQGVRKMCVFTPQFELTRLWIEGRAVHEFNVRAKWAARRAARAKKG